MAPELVERLLVLSQEQGFLTAADRTFWKLYGSPTDPLALAFFALCRARSDGQMCIHTESVPTWPAGFEPQDADALAEAWQSTKMGLAGHPLVGQPGDFRPFIRHDSYLFFQIFHIRRQQSYAILSSFLAQPGRLPDPLFPSRLASMEDRQGFACTAEQREALAMGLSRSLGLITGGPGSGKTTVLAALIELALDFLPAGSIAVATPTGRAAERIQETLRARPHLPDISCTTLHRLLGLPGRLRKRPLSLKLLIVDETSMVDSYLLRELLLALDPGQTRLVFSGDPEQLPSVSPGRSLRDLVDLLGSGPHHVSLAGSHRSSAAIVEVADWLRSGARSPCPAPVQSEANFSQPGAFLVSEDLDSVLTRYWEETFGQSWIDRVRQLSQGETQELFRQPVLEELFQILENHRILTLVHRGPCGQLEINKRGASWLRKKAAGLPEEVGLPILIQENHYGRQLWNGDTGLILSSGGQRVAVFRNQPFRMLPLADLPAYQPAFAHTVHKSQGSEYNTVLFCLPPEPTQNLARDVLYTACTRARQRLFLAGSEAILRAGCQRASERLGGPSWERRSQSQENR